MSNRISHFFFTNNTPTGVNYTSPILSSVVYHDGAEYPYLPGLPFYNGQALDNLPKFVGDCTDRFERSAVGHEQNLIDINERFFNAINLHNEAIVDALIIWGFELSMALGIGDILVDVWEFIKGIFISIPAVPPAEIEGISEKMRETLEYLSRGDAHRALYEYNISKAELEELIQNATSIAEKIRQQEILLERYQFRDLAARFAGTAELWRGGVLYDISKMQGRIDLLRRDLQRLTGSLTWRVGQSFSETSQIGSLITKVNELQRVATSTSTAFLAFMEKIKAVLKKYILNTAIKLKQNLMALKLVRGIVGLLAKIVSKILVYLTPIGWGIMAGIVLYKTNELLERWQQACDTLKESLADSKQQQQNSMKTYYDSIESLLQEGCCDIKPCDPPYCPNGQKHCPDAEGNCAPCESGSGSGSNTLGVGLQLLLEIDGGSITKYIPVTVVGDGNGSGGGGGSDNGTIVDHKPLCEFAPRRNGVYCPPTPSCPKMKNLHFGELYQNYLLENAWNREPNPMDKDWSRGITTTHPPGVDIPNPRTACNWLDLDMDSNVCDEILPLYNTLSSYLKNTIGSVSQIGGGVLDSIDRNNETN
jgi:hypothetical protein